VLRIRDIYPGTDPGSWSLPIPDPRSQIQKQQQKSQSHSLSLPLVSGDKEWGTKTRHVIWTNMPPARGRTAANDLRTKDRSVHKDADGCEEFIDFWQLFFTEEMLELIVMHTNEKIQGELDETRNDS